MGCGSPLASSAGSARARGAPCSPRVAGRKAGSLGARDRHRRCRAISEATRPLRTPGSPALVEAPQSCRPLWCFWGPCSGRSSLRPVGRRVPHAAQPRADPPGALKQPRPRPLRPSKRTSLGKALAQTWWHGQCRLQSCTEIVEPALNLIASGRLCMSHLSTSPSNIS